MIDDDNADIAIVGLACRFPGARDADEFWHNLAGGVESIVKLSDDEILASGVSRAQMSSPDYVKAAAVLDEPGGFDAAFFGFTPNEARTMDPQHRILLELAHAALEDAGCDPARYPGRAGVFAGSAMNTYFMHAGLDRNFAEDYIPTLIVNDKDFLSTRISYKLNLKGPSLTVQTACSTSLVAVHLARQSLLSEEIDLALAGAISVRAPHRAGYLTDAGGVASPDGHVRAFDAAANGTLFGSGGGVVVLKRLRDALADGDTIRAIIKGSAVNNDGAEKAGYTAPSVNSQADAIVEALANADVDAESISYVEAHGSGTPVGDPIEIRALTKAFRSSTQRSGFCAIGSVKTNVGHLDAAAGMAGLIKTVMALQHRQIPASLNFSQPNPEIDFPATPFFVNTKLTPWSSAGGPRRAGIMSTGMGGTNAHVVLEEAPQAANHAASSHPKLLVLSARSETALTASAERLRTFLEANPSTNLDDAAYTLQAGRGAMPHRRFVVGVDHAGMIASLAAKPKRLSVGVVREGSEHPLVLLLPGVGDHYVGMGRELYAAYPAFRQEVDRCAEILRPHLGLDIRDVLYPKHRDWQKAAADRGLDLKKMLAGNTQPPEDDDSRRLNQPALLQPALFTIEYAQARLWHDLGVVPQAIVGHSMGEYVAACLAGVFSLEDALRLIVRRTQLVDQLPPGGMLAVTLPETELQGLLPGDLSISLINGPSLCVVAGPPEAVAEFSRTLATRGVIFRAVQNTHAFHSRLMDPVVGAFEAEVRKVRLSRPRLPFVSNITGRWISDADATDPAYWARHLNHTARFNDALHTVWQMVAPLLLEVGPGKTLGVLANQHPSKQKSEAPLAVSSLRHHYENQPDSEVMLNAVGRLWLSGVEIDWEKLPTESPRRKIPLPTYPFERQNFWLTPSAGLVKSGTVESNPAPLPIDQWFHVPSWERTAFLEGSATSDAGVHWLVFSDRHGNDHGFREALAQNGATVEFVRFGKTLENRTDGSLEIDPRSFEDYLHVFRKIECARHTSIHVVHLGCLGVDATACEEVQDFGFFSLLQIAQAVGELNLTTSVKIAVVSRGLHEVIGDEELDPTMAPVLGACGVIPKEFPNIVCCNIDLAGAPSSTDLSDTHRRWILSEFARAEAGETLAYRGAHRWKRKFVPVTLPPSSQVSSHGSAPAADRLRERGVYLITGGTGGIGLAVARHLAQTCHARLVLTKKTPFPEKSKWMDLANAEGTPEPSARIFRQLLELESMGSEVEVFVAEVSDRDQMQRVFTETLRRYGAIHGVIHTAGIIHDGLIAGKTREVADAVLAPKVQGCEVLYQLSKDAGSDFLVLFSSTASVLGPPGQIDYSAANAYLDAFSHFAHRESGGPHTLTINWPGWREVGILAEMVPAPSMQQWKEHALRKAISTDAGLEAFRRALASNLSQIVVSPTNFDSEIRDSGLPTDARFSESDQQKVSPAPPAESSSTPQTPVRTDQLQDLVVAVWQQILGFDQVGPDDSFFELGGHSLLLIQVHRELCRRLCRQISLLALFQNPSPRTLARYLAAGTAPSPSVDKARLRAERQRQALAARNPRT